MPFQSLSLAAAALLAVPLAAVAAAELPASDRIFPAGANVELVTANCVACHSPGMILNQPKLSAATWTAEVNKMRTVYKAPVAAEDVPNIVAYLAALPVAD
ncbi:MAG: cytochrome c [Pseudomonadota bacterium]|nr:cytochrome c [Pseudomonadota bacterium]